MKISLALIVISMSLLFSQGGGFQFSCSDLPQDECQILPFCHWDIDAGNCLDGDFNYDGGWGHHGNNFCNDLAPNECSDNPFCEWTDEGCHHVDWNNFSCENLGHDDCEWSMMCQWNEQSGVCENPGDNFDFCGGDYSQYCADLEHESCENSLLCYWNEMSCLAADVENVPCGDLNYWECDVYTGCEWDDMSDNCVEHSNPGGDWCGESNCGMWQTWLNCGSCADLGPMMCTMIPFCQWDESNGNCEDNDSFYSAYQLENVDPETGSLDVVLSFDGPFYNFQLNFSGLEITGFSGGLVEEFGFEVNYNGSVIWGNLPGWESIPVDSSALLLTLGFIPNNDVICVYNGHYNGIWSDGNWHSDMGVEASDCVVISSPVDDNFYSDILNGYLDEYLAFNDSTGLGIVGFITIENTDDLEFGDDIGLMDYDGIIDYGECPADEGSVIAGSGTWTDGPVTIPVYGAIDECLEVTERLYPGFIAGNPIYIHAWDESAGVEKIMGTGERSELIWQDEFLIISNISYTFDPNGDGSLDILDVVYLTTLILDYAPYDPVNDQNGDGTIDIIDIIITVNIILYA